MLLTRSSNQRTETDLTDVTYFPASNGEFLSAIYIGLTEPNRPFVLGFAGKPKDRKAWGGEAYCAEKVNTDDPALNKYFSLAVYKPADDSYHRREKDCAAVYGVMLDDLGTKALPLERLDDCPPSYVIETSEGNHQAGYLFIEPVTDFASIKALNQSMVEAGLCDPGAKSPTTRYGRLPFASNGKTDPTFQCKLIEWHPERRYTVEEIKERLQLAPPQKATQKSQPTAIDRHSEDGIYTPRPAENEVISALKTRGLYKSPLGGGKHDITCPWVLEHTDHVDHGSAYFEPNDLYAIGGYKCQHGHGEIYRITALLKYLSITFTAAKHKPTIKAEAGEIGRIADAAERELAATKRYYQRGGLIVSITTDPESKETTIRPMSQPALLRALSGCAIWTRFDSHRDTDVVIDPPAKHVAVLFDSEAYSHLQALAGIARQPHLRSDGSIVREAGFDALTGLFGVFDTRQFNIPEIPTQRQTIYALQELRGLLTEFEFSNEHDETAALASILTAAIRPSLPTAPMFHIKAPQIASGKSYLSGIIATFASPTNPSAVAFPYNDEECQKLLLATLLAAPGTIVFDNLTTDLIPYKSLCSALTEEHLTGRILGVSKTATVRADRARYVSLALTVIRAWIVAGQPTTPCKPLASHGQWSAWIRQPLLWLGLPDPAARVFEQLAQDPDRETLGRLLHAWRDVFGNSPAMIREAVDKCGGFAASEELREALREIAEERGEINRMCFGRWIARHQGRIVDGMRFEKASGTTSAERWHVKSVMSVTSVSVPKHIESVIECFDAETDALCEGEL